MTFNLDEYNKALEKNFPFFKTIQEYIDGDYEYIDTEGDNFISGHSHGMYFCRENDFIRFLVSAYRENKEQLRTEEGFVEFSEKQLRSADTIYNEKFREYYMTKNKQEVEEEVAKATEKYNRGDILYLHRGDGNEVGLRTTNDAEIWDAKDVYRKGDEYIHLYSGLKISTKPDRGFDYNSRGYIMHGAEIEFALIMDDVRVGSLIYTFGGDLDPWRVRFDGESNKSVDLPNYPKHREETILYILNKMAEDMI